MSLFKPKTVTPPVQQAPSPRAASEAVLTSFTAIKPRLFIDADCWSDMTTWTEMCDYEIAGLGFVQASGGNYRVTEVCIFEQEVTGGNATQNTLAVSKYMRELDGAGEGDKIEQMYFQWHSHVEMPATFSATDQRLIDGWAGDTLISVVLNKFGHHSSRIDYKKPQPATYHLDAELVIPRSADRIERCKRDYLDLVSTPVTMGRLARKVASTFGGNEEEAPEVSSVTTAEPHLTAFDSEVTVEITEEDLSDDGGVDVVPKEGASSP